VIAMLHLIQNSGLVGYVVLLIGVYCAVTILRTLNHRADRERAERARRTLVFWGVLAVFLGFLGHTVGIYTALGVILEAESVSSHDVSEALRISLGPVILGLAVMALSGAGWLGLRSAPRA